MPKGYKMINNKTLKKNFTEAEIEYAQHKTKDCRCVVDFCECISVRMDPSSIIGPDGLPHCFECPTSEILMGGGLECYGSFSPHIPYKDK